MSYLVKRLHGTVDTPTTAGRTIRWAFAYDFVVRVLTLNRESALRTETLRLAAIARGATVLDVGCGTGSLTLQAKALAGSDGQVYGIDASPEMITVARRKADSTGAQVNFQVGVIEALDFPDGKFDRVLSSLMMHHLPDAIKGPALTEINRVLKPGGQLLIVDFDTSARRHGLAGMLHRKANADPAELKQLVQGAGFSHVEGGQLSTGSLVFVRATR